jgi:serine/threonine protein kinase
MERVYQAEQQMGTNVRKVAVKTLQAQYAKDQQVLARFHRECGTVSELEHPNTIQFFDFGQTLDGQLYIAMEYAQGQSLSDALQKGAMRPDRVLRLLAQICGSLEEAHHRGVVHRDLKPDNVILTTRAGQADFVKVLDFGIAKRSEAKDQAQEQKLTQQGMVLGTPPYMSPEQFTGKELDARSDIYSLAVMAYERLTGRLPFKLTRPAMGHPALTAQPFPFESVPAAPRSASDETRDLAPSRRMRPAAATSASSTRSSRAGFGRGHEAPFFRCPARRRTGPRTDAAPRPGVRSRTDAAGCRIVRSLRLGRLHAPPVLAASCAHHPGGRADLPDSPSAPGNRRAGRQGRRQGAHHRARGGRRYLGGRRRHHRRPTDGLARGHRHDRADCDPGRDGTPARAHVARDY